MHRFHIISYIWSFAPSSVSIQPWSVQIAIDLDQHTKKSKDHSEKSNVFLFFLFSPSSVSSVRPPSVLLILPHYVALHKTFIHSFLLSAVPHLPFFVHLIVFRVRRDVVMHYTIIAAAHHPYHFYLSCVNELTIFLILYRWMSRVPYRYCRRPIKNSLELVERNRK